MKVTFEPAASADLVRIFEWIRKDNPRAARQVISRIEARIARLAALGFPDIGHPGLIEGTRELVEAPYIIVYRVEYDLWEIVVVSIVHGAQKRRRDR